MKVDNFFTPYTRLNSKWITNLNVRPQTVKLLGKNPGSKFFSFLLSVFWDVSPQARGEKKEKVNKWDYIKLKCFCTAKKTINKRKR